jgi:hypothetical protein
MSGRGCALAGLVLLFAGAVLSPSPTMAGTYYAYAAVDTFIDVENGPNSSFSINPGTNETQTGSSTGNANSSSSVTYGLLNSLPPPLFPGVYDTAQTSGFASPTSPGSSTTSSISIESEVLLYFTQPTLLAFDLVTSTVTTVQTSTPYEFVATFADVNAYFDGSQVYGTSSTAGSFGNGYSYTTTSGGDSPLIYVEAHAGYNELDSVVYGNGYAYTIAPSSVPEPATIVQMGFASIAVAWWCFIRHHRTRRARATRTS